MRWLQLPVMMLTVIFVNANASAWSTQGGETLSPRENAVHAAAGFPWAFLVGYHLPLEQRFELIPEFGLYYGQATSVPLVGNVLDVLMKFRVLSSGALHLSLAAAPGFLMNYYPGSFQFGLQLGLPQVLGTYTVSKVFSLHFGLRMPIALIFYRESQIVGWFEERKKTRVVGWIPILAHFAMEYSVSANVNIFAAMNMGVAIAAGSGGSSADFYPAFLFGGAFKF